MILPGDARRFAHRLAKARQKQLAVRGTRSCAALGTRRGVMLRSLAITKTMQRFPGFPAPTGMRIPTMTATLGPS